MRLFHACDGTIILALAERLRPQLALPGEYLIRQGRRVLFLFFLSRGRALVLRKSSAEGQEHADSSKEVDLDGDGGAGASADKSLGTVDKTVDDHHATTKHSPTSRLAYTRGWARVSPAAITEFAARAAVDNVKDHAFTSGNEDDIVRSITDSQQIIGQLQDGVTGGQTWGAEAFLSGAASNASVRAVSYCDLMVLRQLAFEEVRTIYPSFAALLKPLQEQGPRAAVAKLTKQKTGIGRRVGLTLGRNEATRIIQASVRGHAARRRVAKIKRQKGSIKRGLVAGMDLSACTRLE